MSHTTSDSSTEFVPDQPTWVAIPRELVECVVCMETLTDPRTLCRNEHVVCTSCITDMLQYTKRCPVCRAPIMSPDKQRSIPTLNAIIEGGVQIHDADIAMDDPHQVCKWQEWKRQCELRTLQLDIKEAKLRAHEQQLSDREDKLRSRERQLNAKETEMNSREKKTNKVLSPQSVPSASGKNASQRPQAQAEKLQDMHDVMESFMNMIRTVCDKETSTPGLPGSVRDASRLE